MKKYIFMASVFTFLSSVMYAERWLPDLNMESGYCNISDLDEREVLQELYIAAFPFIGLGEKADKLSDQDVSCILRRSQTGRYLVKNSSGYEETDCVTVDYIRGRCLKLCFWSHGFLYTKAYNEENILKAEDVILRIRKRHAK